MNDISASKAFNFIRQHQVYFKSSFLYIFSAFFTPIIGIAINPLLAKNLSPEDYAIMGYFNSFTLIILPILNFSLISYYLRNYFRIPEERKQIVSNTILIALLIYGFVALVLSCIVFYYYCQWSKISFSYYPYVLLTFTPIYLSNFATLYLAKCRLEREAGKFTVVSIFSGILVALLSISLVVIYKYGATGRLMATLLGSIVTGVYCFKKMFGNLQFDFDVIKEALKFGWPLSLSAILWFFLSGIDRAMLEKLNDSYTFGFYNVGFQITGYLAMLYPALAQTFEPDIYKTIADNNKRKLLRIIISIISLNAIFNLIFITFAPFIIGILTYNRYTDSSGFAQIMALKNITITFYYSAITVIVGYGFTKSELFIRLIGAILCIVMYKWLIENYAFYGAAWGQVFSFVIMTVISVFFLFYQLRKSNRYA